MTRRRLKTATSGILVVLAAVASVVVVGEADAQTTGDPELTVTIERVRDIVNGEPADLNSEADFYPRVNIAGQGFQGGNELEITDDDDITPEWEFSETVAIDAGVIDIELEIWDDDSPFGAEQVNINGVDVGLTITVDVAACANLTSDAVTGPAISAPCRTSIVSAGGFSKSAEITFTIAVVEPAAAPGLNVSCTTNLLAPQAGDIVRIQVVATDGSLDPLVVIPNLRLILADRLQIWFDDHSGSGPQLVTDQAPSPQEFGTVTLAPTATEYSYACQAEDSGLVAWSGWRTVSLQPATSTSCQLMTVAATTFTVRTVDPCATPVMITGPRRSSLDLVMVADETSYTGADDLAFIAAARRLLFSDLLQARDPADDNEILLRHQDRINIYLSTETGRIGRDLFNQCAHEAPVFGWADVVVVVHNRAATSFRNCAMRGSNRFSARGDGSGVARHELGHTPFGLSDEYQDSTPFQSEFLPNVFHDLDDLEFMSVYVPGCESDAVDIAAGGFDPTRTAADCHLIEADFNWFEDIFVDSTYYSSDPPNSDLMVDDSPKTARGSDVRRIEWWFSRCEASLC